MNGYTGASGPFNTMTPYLPPPQKRRLWMNDSKAFQAHMSARDPLLRWWAFSINRRRTYPYERDHFIYPCQLDLLFYKS
ncbi:hypothetical protein M0802_006938 [Mischocyttarus mexicanus]|nr:hypothetical protein M0802_006938 [Mischocyttarus mexicanus]